MMKRTRRPADLTHRFEQDFVSRALALIGPMIMASSHALGELTREDACLGSALERRGQRSALNRPPLGARGEVQRRSLAHHLVG